LRKASADVGDRRLDLFGRANIDQQNVILAFRARHGALLSGDTERPTVEASPRYPCMILEHTSPTPLIGDVVSAFI